MLSRVADSLYWIGRYVERAEDTARLTDVAYHYTLGMGNAPEAEERRRRHWEALVGIAGEPARFHERYSSANEDTVAAYLTFDRQNPNSIASCVASAREQARVLRHQIASEMWEALNRFFLEIHRQQSWSVAGAGIENAHHFFRAVKEFSHLFQGVTDSTMPRDEGWHFLQAGRSLERATKTARALDVKFHLLLDDIGAQFGPELDDVPGELHQWQALLRSFSAYEAYHKLYRSAVRPTSMVEMIVFSPVFPRSIRFAVEQANAALAGIAAARSTEPETGWPEHLPFAALAGGADDISRMTGRLRARLAFGSIEEVFANGLHPYLHDVQGRCVAIGDAIQREYFAPRIMRPEEVVA